MALEQRRIIIGYENDGTPNYKMLRASNQEEMNIKIVQSFIESGRIYEFLPTLTSTLSTSEKRILLKDYAPQWLSRKRKLKETTRTFYEKHLNQYIIPDLGEKYIGDITSNDVQEMLDKHKNLSAKTLKEMKGVLSQVFRYAVSDELVIKNPCISMDIEIPSTKRSERFALPIDYYHEIISNLYKLDLTDRRFLALCLFTAMRRGEVLGLCWEDVHHGMIHVKRNVTHPQRNQPEITTPKTKAGFRSIPLTEPLKDILLPTKPKGFIIGGESPFTLSAYRAMWKRITQTIDMHGATPHTLRHSYLTYAVGKTSDYKTIQGLSGHSDVFTLMNRYAHPQEEKKVELSKEISKILTEM